MDTFVDLISTGGNNFLQLKDLKYSTTDKNLIEFLKQFQDNAYIKNPEGVDAQMMSQFFHSLNSHQFNKQITEPLILIVL